jgi:hypothetical protein
MKELHFVTSLLLLGVSELRIFSSIVKKVTCHEGTEGEQRYSCSLSLTSALYVVGSKTLWKN